MYPLPLCKGFMLPTINQVYAPKLDLFLEMPISKCNLVMIDGSL